MVFKALTGGTGGDLYTPADSYGYFNDTIYVVNQASAYSYAIFTYGGNDTVDLRNANSGNFHNVYTGRGNDIVLGGAGNESIHDTDGNDTCLLGGNSDYVYAGAGNDVYDGGTGTDYLDFEYIYDNMGASVANNMGVVCDLKITIAQFISSAFGTDVIRSFEQVGGSFGNDILSGTDGQDGLWGGGGNDVLFGRGGNDRIYGNFGADTLVGGLGADLMDCGIEIIDRRDHVRYNSTSESGIGTAITVIDRTYNFDKGGTATDDKIDLSRIDARASTMPLNESFWFNGTAAFSRVGGEVRLQVIGADTLVHIDTDADAATEMNFRIVGVTGLTAADFIF